MSNIGDGGASKIRAPATRRKKSKWIAAVIAAIAVAAISAGPLLSQVEQPDFKTTASDGPCEIREYGSMIAAEADVKGQRQAAIGEGFRLIAAYIFGNNAPGAKIAMTTPVQQQSQQSIAQTSIEMTAPVTQQAAGGVWKVRFIMPKKWTMETLPAPNDARVTLKAIPAKRFAVVRFSGRGGDELIQEKTMQLRRFIDARRLTSAGEPVLAFYNPPWTLPILRRNEIMLELADPK
jgi:SOUL heme-binding protein